MNSTLVKSNWKDRIDNYLVKELSSNEKKLFYSITLIKLLMVLIPPIGTTDLERNIFYGKNWWKYFFSLYNLTPLEVDINYSVYDPLTNLLSWPSNTYDYPAIHLLFFAIIGLFPIAKIVIAKSMLVFFDFANFYLIKRYGWNKNCIKIVAFLYYLLNTYFSSIEGQVESITVFFLLLSLQLYNIAKYRKYSYIILGLGFHWKIIQIILLPYFVIKDLSLKRLKWEDLFAFISVFALFWILPLLQGNYLYNSQFFTGFNYSEITPWNPFFIGINKISGYLNIIMILFICLLIAEDLLARKNDNNIELKHLVDYLPLISLLTFWGFIYEYGNPWGWVYYIPALLIIPEKNIKKISIGLLLLMIIGIIDYIILANIFDNIKILFGINT